MHLLFLELKVMCYILKFKVCLILGILNGEVIHLFRMDGLLSHYRPRDIL